MTSPAPVRHRLSSIDEDEPSAWCAACQARVAIYKKRESWSCTPANRARAAEWRAAPGNVDRERATKARLKAEQPERWHAQKRAASFRYNEAHRQELRDKNNAKRERLRAEALAAYGERCACPGCHVVHAELLTIDHINGDGAEHRRSLGRGTRDFYGWLKRQGYPPEFQALCGSCNIAKGTRPECPLHGQDH